MKLAIQFPTFGPYHLARMRSLSELLEQEGGHLVAYETSSLCRRYPWSTPRVPESFEWITLFPGSTYEDIPAAGRARAMVRALDRDRPDAVLILGYYLPEAVAALSWANRRTRPAILMCDSRKVDFPRVWWKEAFKRRRVRRFSGALVSGPSSHDYMIDLGIRPDRVVQGIDVVDNAFYERLADGARAAPGGRHGLPDGPYFLTVSRYDPKKNLQGLIRAFARYRARSPEGRAWDLVICGGGPEESAIEKAVEKSGVSGAIHRPGFLQADALATWYAFASAFVLPSRMDQWGLVVNEAAACGLPLLVSDGAGCAEALVPDPPGTTGRRFSPSDVGELAEALAWMADLTESDRAAMGRRAAEAVAGWGPDRFARGALEAIGSTIGGPSLASAGGILRR